MSYDIDFLTLRWDQDVAASLVAFWVYLAVGMLGAFAISFYFTANTIIYYLMRHEVDATELDDVYVEQSEEDFADATAPPATASAVPTTAPATDAGPAAAPGATSGTAGAGGAGGESAGAAAASSASGAATAASPEVGTPADAPTSPPPEQPPDKSEPPPT